MIVDDITKMAEGESIPVLGFGPASTMADERPGHRPEDLLPGAQTLICFGLPVPQGVYQTPTYTLEAVWRSQNLNYRRLDTLSMRVAALLEDDGARAVPIYGCLPMGVNERGQVVGYLNQIQMGRATGIGVMGKNGLLIHSRYGARLMLGGVVTTADLPEGHYPDIDEPGCSPDCRICADVCPVQAISIEKKRVRIMTCLGHTARTPQQIDLARQNVPAGHFLHGDAASVQFPAASFDAVVSFYTLEHIPRREHPALLRRIHRWLRAGGLLLVSMEAGEYDDVIGQWLGVPMFISCFDPETTKRLVDEAGFELLETAVETQIERGHEVPFLWLLAHK
jgi:ferredoxin